jgi:glycogen phosphorylase
MLQEVDRRALEAFAEDRDFLRDVEAQAEGLRDYLARPEAAALTRPGPVVYLSAEVGIHESLPVYAGGLGVLMGDFLKEASDQALPAAAVSLLYWQGYFHQRLDASGWQYEYWLDSDAPRLPAALVCDASGEPLTVTISLRGRPVFVQVWRVDVGRVPLFLLDSNRPDNAVTDRWITSRLYISDYDLRLLQYLLLGIGGIRAIAAMGLTPSLYHLNEGHAAFAPFELLRRELADGQALPTALESVRARTTFTTHTPVPAGHDVFSEEHLGRALPELSASEDLWRSLMELGRGPRAGDAFGTTQFALKTSGSTNAVSRRHGDVTRRMWQGLWPREPLDLVPIDHVTNGVHLPTWMAPEMQALLERYLPPDWRTNPASWEAIDRVPDEELWQVRCRLSRRLVEHVRARSVWDRLGRGESVEYASSAAEMWNEKVLTLGFARRIATYKRLHLLTTNPERGLRILNSDRPVQLAIAGKAHPRDDDAKRSVQQVFALNRLPNAASRVVFLEDQSIGTERLLIQGCDLWLNFPRPPQEASGTSGMKSVLNGGLQLSTLDGWWAEAYDGSNGWGIDGSEDADHGRKDHEDSEALFALLENEIVPLFYDQDERGVPHRWVQRIKASMKTLGYQFSARRMVQEYFDRYAAR